MAESTKASMDSLRANLREFVVRNFLFGKSDDLADDTSFLEQGIIDSTGVLELVSHLEERYGIQVEDNELNPDNLDSIVAIAEYVSRKTGASAAELSSSGAGGSG